MDSPELGRLVVVQGAIIGALLQNDTPAEELLLEHDALTMVIARRVRSAVHYHETIRGKDALANAAVLAELGNPDEVVSLVRMRFSQEQALNPFLQRNGPEEEIYIPFDARGVALLAEVNQGPPVDPEPIVSLVT